MTFKIKELTLAPEVWSRNSQEEKAEINKVDGVLDNKKKLQ